MAALVQIIITLVIIGVLVWAARKLLGLVPMEPWIAQVVDVIIVVACVLAIVFYVILPLLGMVAGGIHAPSFR